MSLKLGVLISGGGTNLQAILDAVADQRLDAEILLVLSNRADAFGLERAKKAGVATAVVEHRDFSDRESFDEKMVAELRAHGVEWVALAGFMRVLTPVFIEAFEGKMINIHPSLLPAFPGVNSQKQAFEYGVKIAGCTVHFVDGGVDTGPIIAQAAVPVLADDSAESLKARILKEEHQLFVDALIAAAEGRLELKLHAGRQHVVTHPRAPQSGDQQAG